MTEQQKYREAFKTLQSVAEQMSHFATHDFLANMGALRTLQTQLAEGKRIYLGDGVVQQDNHFSKSRLPKRKEVSGRF